MNRFVKLAAVGVALTALASCAAMKDKAGHLNPFKATGPKTTAAKGERIPVLAFEQGVKPSDALAGAGYSLPDPHPITAWPLPGGTADQSAENVEAAPALEVAWKRGIGRGSGAKTEVTATPVAVDGRIFTLDGQANVVATNAKTGARDWQVNLRPKSRRDREGFGGGLAVDEGKVYVTSGFRFVTALDAITGKVLWHKAVTSPIHSAPTVSNGRVYAVDVDNQIIAFDSNTGEQAWSFQAIVEPARILKASSPAVSGEQVVAPFSSGELVSLSATNGNTLWDEALSRETRTNALSEIRDIPGRPVIYRGDVYAASQSGVFAAVDLRSGNVRWQLPIASVNSPWPAGDVVFIVSKAGELIAISRDSGQVYWIVDLNKGHQRKAGTSFTFGFGIGRHFVNPIWSGPMLAGNRLIVVNDWGEVEALDAKTGAVQKEIKIGDASFIAPIAYDGMIYLVTDKADLVAIR
jgi:outer membrane protein assembly factor BamB